MKLSDLKTGMLVITRDKTRRIVLRGIIKSNLFDTTTDIFITKDGHWSPFKNYTEDLHYTGKIPTPNSLDIMKVYTPKNIYGYFPNGEDNFDLGNYSLRWARVEHKDEPKINPEIQELHKTVESIEWALAEIKAVLERKEEKRKKKV